MKSAVFIAVTLFAATAMAQTSPGLMIAPWQDETHVEFDASASFFNSGRTDSPANDSVQLQIIDAQGRAALSTDDPQLRFGFDSTYINIRSADAALPGRLVDQSLAVGFGISEWDGWQLGAVVGGGYAGNNPYADSDALYGIANLILSRELTENTSVQFILNYQGNRPIFPDTPLPGIVYNHRVSDTLSYSVGFPFSTITWEPVDRLTLGLQYSVPFTFDVHANYEVVDNWHVFGALGSRTRGFTLDDDRDHRRLFFSQGTAELGVRWQSSPRCHVLLAGGYAFNREFEYGYDVRDLDTVRDLTDEPYLRAAVGFSF